MNGSRVAALCALVFIASTTQAFGQGLREARRQLPVFKTDEESQNAQLYVYYPSVDAMVKLEVSSVTGVFSDSEFGYLVGDMHSEVSGVLASAWYGDIGEERLTLVSSSLEDEAKAMRRPFQEAIATLTLKMDRAGIAFTYSGVDESGMEVSFTVNATWEQVMAEQ